jgi:hypothetical protein
MISETAGAGNYLARRLEREATGVSDSVLEGIEGIHAVHFRRWPFASADAVRSMKLGRPFAVTGATPNLISTPAANAALQRSVRQNTVRASF